MRNKKGNIKVSTNIRLKSFKKTIETKIKTMKYSFLDMQKIGADF